MKTQPLYSRLTALAITICATVVTVAAQNDYKIMESSAKKAPVWFEKSQSDYIITSAIAPTIDEARDQCMDNVRKKIIESVAQNVQFSTQSNVSQNSSTGGIDDFRDSFTSSLKTQAAKVPFIKGISVSKIEDSYWQKRQQKSNKAVSYIYAIKYPFPSLELKKLVRTFEEQDAEMMNQLISIESGLDNITNLTQIERAISSCAALEEYFFDDVRKARTRTLLASYLKLYNNISVSSNDVKLGETQLMFQLAGRGIAVSQIPAMKSECATQLQYNVSGDMGVLKYGYENCMDDQTNEISLTYRFGTRVLKHTVYFCPDNFKALITPQGMVLISKLEEGFTLDMEIVTAKTPSVTIDEVTLEIPDIEGVVMLDKLGKTVNGDGNHRLSFTTTSPVRWAQTNGLTNIMRGTMRGTYGEAKTPFTRSFTLIYKIKVNL